jgi:hypothetical protein
MDGPNLAATVRPTTSGKEATVVLTLIDELRTGLGLEIDPSPSFEREPKLNTTATKKA